MEQGKASFPAAGRGVNKVVVGLGEWGKLGWERIEKMERIKRMKRMTRIE